MAVCFMIVLLERSCIQSVLFLTTCLKLKKLESSHARHCKIIPLSQFLLFIPLQKNRRKGDTATCLFYEHCGGWKTHGDEKLDCVLRFVPKLLKINLMSLHVNIPGWLDMVGRGIAQASLLYDKGKWAPPCYSRSGELGICTP